MPRPVQVEEAPDRRIIQRRRVEDPLDRRIVTGMVVSDRFLRDVQVIYQPHLVSDTACRTVAGWCMEYFSAYAKAPGAHIQDIFESHARNGLDEDQADTIALILTKASEEHERGQDHFNVDYLLDQTEKQFRRRSLLSLAEDIKAALASPHAEGLDEAERAMEDYRRVERPQTAGLCPLTDRSAIREAFTSQAEPLFRYPKAVGTLLNGAMVRGGFVALLAPPKRGKSWTLMELALKAASAGNHVAFFECGDMTRDQWLRRFHVRLAFRPFRHYRPEYAGTVDLPSLIDPDTGELAHTPHPVEPLGWKEAIKGGEDYLKKKLGRGQLRLSCHPTGTLTLSQARTQLDLWERVEEWIPDVVLFDYADILAPDLKGAKEHRHQQNELWKGLRALSQERSALVLTATQSDAEGMERKLLTMRNFSEDMRKLAHVTAMFGLNQTPEEKRLGLLRFNEIVVREGESDALRSATVLQALRVGRPILDSYWTPTQREEEN